MLLPISSIHRAGHALKGLAEPAALPRHRHKLLAAKQTVTGAMGLSCYSASSCVTHGYFLLHVQLAAHGDTTHTPCTAAAVGAASPCNDMLKCNAALYHSHSLSSTRRKVGRAPANKWVVANASSNARLQQTPSRQAHEVHAGGRCT
jgi:hypothetical protein